MKLRESDVIEFLDARIEEIEVVEITDGEITLQLLFYPNPKLITLYLNHDLNEGQGLPKEFNIKR